MNDWIICVVWVFTLFVAYYFGHEQGYKVGKLSERAEWIKDSFKPKDELLKWFDLFKSEDKE